MSRPHARALTGVLVLTAAATVLPLAHPRPPPPTVWWWADNRPTSSTVPGWWPSPAVTGSAVPVPDSSAAVPWWGPRRC